MAICFSFNINILSAKSASAFLEPISNLPLNDYSNLISDLQFSENIKDQIGLSNVDYSDFTVSNVIKTYNYTNNGLTENFELYPLMVNNELTAIAIKSEDEYQITTSLVNEINSLIQPQTKFALIYDYDCCYLYDGNNLNLLKQTSIKSDDRSQLSSVNDIKGDSTIELNNLLISSPLGYSSPQASINSTIYYECDIEFVSQDPPSNICWAASIACIVNYKKNRNLTAVNVAKMFYGNNYDRGLPLGQEASYLSGYYNLPYTYKNRSPAGIDLINNLKQDHPIFAIFEHSSGYHSVIIYGIDQAQGYIKIMDPEIGFCLSRLKQGVYQFNSLYSGVSLSLHSGSCIYWARD